MSFSSDHILFLNWLRDADEAMEVALKFPHILKVEQFHELSAARTVIQNIKKEIERGK